MPLTTFTAGTRILSSDVNANFALCLTKEDVTTAGAILFGSGTRIVSEDSAKLFWDSTNYRLGIGTGSPISNLHISITGAASVMVTGTTTASFSLKGQSTTTIQSERYSDDTSSSTMVVRKSRGTIASPTAVTSGDEAGILYFQVYGGTNSRNIASVRGYVDTYTSDSNISGYLAFYTSPSGSATGTEKMRIDAAGNIGIGAAASAWGSNIIATELTATTPFFVGQNTEAVVHVSANLYFNGTNYIYKNNGYSTDYFQLNGTHTWRYAASGAAGGTISFSTAMQIDASGVVGVGLTPTSRNNTTFQIKDGIGFPATQVSSTDVNTLDDYEEGTFTPTVVSTTGTITTVGTTSGSYTKVGNKVTVWFKIAITTNGTGAGFIKITNLPFTVSSSKIGTGSSREMIFNGLPGMVYADSSTTNAYIMKYDGTYPGLDSTRFDGTIIYYV